MSRLLVDTTPLRVSPDFRRLWSGQAVSFFGTTITTAALPYQVFHATNSSLDVGLLGLAQLGPLLGFSLIGGALADSFDKRRLLLIVSFVSLAFSAVLGFNASLDHTGENLTNQHTPCFSLETARLSQCLGKRSLAMRWSVERIKARKCFPPFPVPFL